MSSSWERCGSISFDPEGGVHTADRATGAPVCERWGSLPEEEPGTGLFTTFYPLASGASAQACADVCSHKHTLSFPTFTYLWSDIF